jgi:hypothetical protein
MSQPKPETKVVITKVDSTSSFPASVPAPVGGKKRSKSMKTFPKGVLKKTLKVKPVADPAKPPPVKKSMRKHTIRLFTDRGEIRRRKTIKRRVSKMTEKQVDEMVKKHNLLKNDSTPPKIKREMLSGAMLAGFIPTE